VRIYEKEKKETEKCKNFSKFKFTIAIEIKETLRSQEIEKNVQNIVHLIMNSPRTYEKKTQRKSNIMNKTKFFLKLHFIYN